MIQHHFRRRNAQALYDVHYGPNMTPMVDVVMVILIFFMASAAMLGPEWFIRANLPRAASVSTPSSDLPPLRITLKMLHADGVTMMRVNDQAPDLAMEQMPGALATATDLRPAEEIVVIVEPAAEVPYEDVVALHAICQRLGIVRVGLGEPPAAAPEP